jgi:electron transport complex protein RnfC
MPLVERCVTFDGSATAHPMNIIVPIGTSIREIADFAGGFDEPVGKVLFGGPMMGSAAANLDEPITKTTNGITVINTKDSIDREATSCIHCGRCVDVCPMSLNPTGFEKALKVESKEDRMARLEDGRVNLCMECGSCSFVCPAKRPLIQSIRLGKTELRTYKAHQANLK